MLHFESGYFYLSCVIHSIYNQETLAYSLVVCSLVPVIQYVNDADPTH